MTEALLFHEVQGCLVPSVRFDGKTFDPELDGQRINAQLRRVRDLMADGVWRTLSEISEATGDPEASASARLRDLRKERFGSYIVNRRRRGEMSKGVWEYQILTPAAETRTPQVVSHINRTGLNQSR